VTNEIDTCIIGQGLAGTTLAWALHRMGQQVAVIDRDEHFSSSRIAAGLITPVTGKRFVKSWQFDDFWPVAVKFYKAIEKETKTNFFHQRNSVRLFASQEEEELFTQKSNRDFPELVRVPETPVDEISFDNSFGEFEMTQAARLDVPLYLDTSRDYFSRRNSYFTASIDPATDLQFENNTVILKQLGLRTKRIIFCEGFSGSKNRWFETVRFDAAKGEILTVRIPGLNEHRVMHRGIWLVAIGEDLFRMGATYDREILDTMPTDAGRDELCSRLTNFMRLPFEVLDHHAAVRPIILGRKPLIGFHPQYLQLGYFNGLGSKGSLQAPWFADTLAQSISVKTKIPSEFDVAQHMNFQDQ
jgi:glycine oxidase